MVFSDPEGRYIVVLVLILPNQLDKNEKRNFL